MRRNRAPIRSRPFAPRPSSTQVDENRSFRACAASLLLHLDKSTSSRPCASVQGLSTVYDTRKRPSVDMVPVASTSMSQASPEGSRETIFVVVSFEHQHAHGRAL